MKQLLHQFAIPSNGTDADSKTVKYWVVGIKDQAFLGTDTSQDLLLELIFPPLDDSDTNDNKSDENGNNNDSNKEENVGEPPMEALQDDNQDITTKSQSKSSEQKQQPGHNFDVNDIQAVAGCVVQETTGENKTQAIYAAVARANKTLCIFQINDFKSLFMDETTTSTTPELLPVIVHQTAKRVSSLSFAQVSNPDSGCPLTVLVAGDLVGDVVAYSLTESSSLSTANRYYKESQEETRSSNARRLLLGHTASMLTSLEVTSDLILTADRDEKIRVSHFPATHVIHGFLLGHTSFITDTSAFTSDQLSCCVSCGGDGTLRVWNYRTCQELTFFNLNGTDPTLTRPIKVAVLPKNKNQNTWNIAVIYDESPCLDILEVTISDSQEAQIKRIGQITLASQPLGVVPWTGSHVAVLVQKTDFLLSYSLAVKEDGSQQESPNVICKRLAHAVKTQPENISGSILERDRFGNLAMDKNAENRGGGSAQHQPWNNAKRKDAARAANRRNRNRGKKRRKGDNDNDDNEMNEAPDSQDDSQDDAVESDSNKR